MSLICKVRLIISKCWLIVRIVDNVHKTQNVFSKHRRSMINIIVFLLFSILVKILWSFSLRTDRTIMSVTIHSRLCTFDNTIMFLTITHSCFLLWEFCLLPHHVPHLSIKIDTIKIEIKSECFRVLNTCQRVTVALPDPALISSSSVSVSLACFPWYSASCPVISGVGGCPGKMEGKEWDWIKRKRQ